MRHLVDEEIARVRQAKVGPTHIVNEPQFLEGPVVVCGYGFLSVVHLGGDKRLVPYPADGSIGIWTNKNEKELSGINELEAECGAYVAQVCRDLKAKGERLWSRIND